MSAALFPKRRVATILLLGAQGLLEIYLSPFILAELALVLTSPKIGFTPSQLQETIALLREVAHIIHPKTHFSAITTDDADNRILECAVAAKADVLVTGDLKHIRPLGRFKGTEILTPREFLDKHFPSG